MSNKFTPEEDIQALSQRNLQNFMKTLSNKTVQKSIESLAKIEKEEWSSIAETAKTLKSIVEGGDVFGSIVDNITETVKLKIESLTAPITNEITTAINDILNPFILTLAPVINNLTNFFIENPTGTGVGGIAGAVVGAFLGSPALGALIGAALGAGLEEYFKWVDTIYPDESQTGSAIGFFQWRIERGGGTPEEYAIWLTNQSNVNTYLPGQNDYRSGR